MIGCWLLIYKQRLWLNYWFIKSHRVIIFGFLKEDSTIITWFYVINTIFIKIIVNHVLIFNRFYFRRSNWRFKSKLACLIIVVNLVTCIKYYKFFVFWIKILYSILIVIYITYLNNFYLDFVVIQYVFAGLFDLNHV